MKCAKYIKQVFKFRELYLHNSDMIPKNHTNPNSDFYITLIGNLSQCQFEENTVPSGLLSTISWQNNLVEVILALFILWQYFPDMFIETDTSIYK